MSANLPQPLSHHESLELISVIEGRGLRAARDFICEELKRTDEIATTAISFALAHLAAEYGLDPTGKR